jgi:arabinosaccharide transport system substrate-binding protein
MQFPYGIAPLVILILAIASGGVLVWQSSQQAVRKRPDLVYQTFAKDHVRGLEEAAADFLKLTGKHVEIQLVDQRALQNRLQAQILSGAEVPDLVEIVEPSMGTFTRGPLADVGFIDLTDRLLAEGWMDKLVPSRFSLWSSRGRIFGLPHDVHPVMLAYRRDLVEQLGIDVEKLTTWDEFARVGREITKDLNGDGLPDRYMVDFFMGGGGTLQGLLLQRDVQTIDADGNVAFDTDAAADTIAWYIKQISGKDRIAFECGWGQNLSKAMIDGLALFYFCPDWRSRSFQSDVPSLSGKLALMPLPAWKPGDRRTTVWGGTCLSLLKRGRDPELAWKFATYAYYNPAYLGRRFQNNNILPPLKAAFDLPELNEPDPFYSGQKRGALYAALAPHTPVRNVSPFTALAESKLNEAFTNSLTHFERTGSDVGLRDYVKSELTRTAAQVRGQIGRNRFYGTPTPTSAATPTATPTPTPAPTPDRGGGGK